MSHSATVNHVLQTTIWVQTEALSNAFDAFWSKVSLSVDVQSLSLTTTKIISQLGSDAQGMAKLCFASTKLAEELCNALALDSTTEKFVELSRPSCDFANALSHFHHLKASSKCARADRSRLC
jgi:hypothetical protein